MNYNIDYYKILGVHVYSDKKEIKKSYKKLALKYHPDINKNPSSEKKFKKINEAYNILYDDKKRKEYDKIRASKFMKNRKTTINIQKVSNKQKQSNNSDSIAKGVKIASTLEKDYGLISGLLNLHPTGRKINSIIGKSSNKRRNSSSFIDTIISNGLNKNNDFRRVRHRHRYEHNLY